MYYFSKPDIKFKEQIEMYRFEYMSNNIILSGIGNLRWFSKAEDWIKDCERNANPETCPKKRSIYYQYMYIDKEADEIVGMIEIRPKAMEHPVLSSYGGHISFSILPSRRRQGLGTKMLKEFLPLCKELGLEKVLIVCPEDKVGARKVILKNGGVFENSIFSNEHHCNMERYWIDL